MVISLINNIKYYDLFNVKDLKIFYYDQENLKDTIIEQYPDGSSIYSLLEPNELQSILSIFPELLQNNIHIISFITSTIITYVNNPEYVDGHYIVTNLFEPYFNETELGKLYRDFYNEDEYIIQDVYCIYYECVIWLDLVKSIKFTTPEVLARICYKTYETPEYTVELKIYNYFTSPLFFLQFNKSLENNFTIIYHGAYYMNIDPRFSLPDIMSLSEYLESKWYINSVYIHILFTEINSLCDRSTSDIMNGVESFIHNINNV